jgi:FlaA1/EpsC-like NDP-sugar epimerase
MGPLRQVLEDRMIIVTGAAGTVGSRTIERLASMKSKVIAIDNDPQACQALSERIGTQGCVEIVCDDICNPSIEPYFKGATEVFHLAASKDIVNCESLVTEALRTNIHGTKNILDLCVTYDIATLVFSSTDKAANPTSVLGMTKLLAERLVTEYSIRYNKKYYSVRFGNILGSSGSIVPIVMEKVRNNQPITITDVEMTRFVLSLDESVDMLFNTREMANIGDVFIKKMLSLKIFDLIKAVVERYKGGDKFSYNIIGPRKAEKIHEELIGNEEIHKITEARGYWIINQTQCHQRDSNITVPAASNMNLLEMEDVRKLVNSMNHS